MTAPLPLTPIEVAMTQLLGTINRVSESETLPIGEACGRVLIEDVKATMNVPPHASSAMDGYAVFSANTQRSDTVLPVTQRIPAGKVGSVLVEGEAARIFTGAPLPDGADAVVMQENAEVLEAGVKILKPASNGENLRLAGEDIAKGAVVFNTGHRLQAQDLGVLAAIGRTDIRVCRRLKVALLTTGDEIVDPGRPLLPGQIYNSNLFSISNLLASLGVQVIAGGTIPDNLEATKRLLSSMAESADCVITTGGVSVGEEDHVKSAIESIGILDLWKLAIKPGKPFASGKIGNTHFFGLPGNPVSAFVTFVLLARPALLALSGCTKTSPLSFLLAAGFDQKNAGIRQEYVRVKVEQTEQGSCLIPYQNQSSGVTASLSFADGLAVIPPETTVSSGDSLRFIPFSELVN